MVFSLLAIAAILSQTFLPSNCQSKITISPSSLTRTSTASCDLSSATFSVSCEFAVIGFTFAKAQLHIARSLSINSSFTVRESVAGIDALRNNRLPILYLNTSTVKISGSLEMGSLTVTFTKPNCKDEGMYICTATVSKDGGGTVVFDSSANLTVIGPSSDAIIKSNGWNMLLVFFAVVMLPSNQW